MPLGLDKTQGVKSRAMFQTMLNESTMLKVRSCTQDKDADAALTVKLSDQCQVSLCCGINFKETFGAQPDKANYDESYFGINFDV